MEIVGELVYVLGGYDDGNEEGFWIILVIEKFKLVVGEWEDCGYFSMLVWLVVFVVYREKIFLFGGVIGEDYDIKIV